MALQFTNTGVATGQPVEASQISQSFDAFTGAEAYDINISGSLVVEGPVDFDNASVTGSSFTGSFTGSLDGVATNALAAETATSSSHALISDTSLSSSYILGIDVVGAVEFADTATSSSYALSSSYSLSSSQAESSSYALSSSYSLTASYALNGGGGGSSVWYDGTTYISASLPVSASSFRGISFTASDGFVTPGIRNAGNTSYLLLKSAAVITHAGGVEVQSMGSTQTQINTPLSSSGLHTSGDINPDRNAVDNIGKEEQVFNKLYLSAEALYMSGSSNYMTASYNDDALLINGNPVVQSSQTSSLVVGEIEVLNAPIGGGVQGPFGAEILTGIVVFIGGSTTVTISTYSPQLSGKTIGVDCIINLSVVNSTGAGPTNPPAPPDVFLNPAGDLIFSMQTGGSAYEVNYMILSF
tara:strand:- start:3332 stop:4573 length:1242 start_codon:yes stop_codon:yes gene_type:complete